MAQARVDHSRKVLLRQGPQSPITEKHWNRRDVHQGMDAFDGQLIPIGLTICVDLRDCIRCAVQRNWNRNYARNTLSQGNYRNDQDEPRW